MLNDISKEVERGTAFYSKSTLVYYDFMLYNFMNPVVWKCRTKRISKLYADHLSDNHLDVATGTGYFIDRTPFPSEKPRLALLDLNSNCLEKSSARLSRYTPELIQANVLAPIPYSGDRFHSISLTYLLHCLPGKSLVEKFAAIDNLIPLMHPEGVMFGANILNRGVFRSPLTWMLIQSNNRLGIFANKNDSLEDMHAELAKRFQHFTIEKHGVVVLWSASSPIV